MIFLVYNLFLTLTSPIWALWMLWRTKKRKEAPNWKERTGDYDIVRRKDRKRIWVHAVSVGEVMAAGPILREIKKLCDYEIVLTATTSTGYKVAQSLKGKSADYVFYFPIDVARFCVAALTRVEPSVVVILETELWLNFLTAAKGIGARTVLANGRISDRSFRKSKYLRWFYKAIFAKLDECLMQTQQDAKRVSYFGAKNAKVLGNSKYDEADAAPSDVDWRQELHLQPGEKMVVVGSVRGEEEEHFVVEALQGIDAKLVVAPRHLERSADLARELGAGLRSKGENAAKAVVLDTFGELAGLYSFADVAVVGGGFSNLGGQNIIQPMAAGCPVICGPHMKNFREPFEAGKEAGAIQVVSSPSELRAAVEALLNDESRRKTMGEAGKSLVRENLGASKRYATEIVRLAKDFETQHQGHA